MDRFEVVLQVGFGHLKWVSGHVQDSTPSPVTARQQQKKMQEAAAKQ